MASDEEDNKSGAAEEDNANEKSESRKLEEAEEKSEVNSAKKRKETSQVSEELEPKKAKREESPGINWISDSFSEAFVNGTLHLAKRDRQERRKLQLQDTASEIPSKLICGDDSEEEEEEEEDEVSNEESNEESWSGKEDEGRSLVAKEKTNDQGKGQASKKAKPVPSRLELRKAVVDIVLSIQLKDPDDMLMELGARFKVDLSHRQEEIQSILSQITRLAESALIDESALEDDGEDGVVGEKAKEENGDEDDTPEDDKNA